MQTSGTKYAWELLQAADCQPHELGQDACTGFPGLQPWIQTEVETDGTVRLERNPWYFKVDPAGRQLPYIDTLAVLPPADPLPPSPTAVPGPIWPRPRTAGTGEPTILRWANSAATAFASWRVRRIRLPCT